MGKLTATAVKNTKATGKAYKLTDGGGLYLFVTAKGAKSWRYDYRLGGKRATLTLGTYPALSLADARDKHREAHKQVSEGIDPGEVKKAEKRTRQLNNANSFKAVAWAWFDEKQVAWSSTHRDRTKYLLSRIEGELGHLPIGDIRGAQVLAAARTLRNKDTGKVNTPSASKAINACSGVWNYAVARDFAAHNVCTGLVKELPHHTIKNHAAIIEPAPMGELLAKFDEYGGSPITIAALRVTAYLAQRQGNIREWRWEQIDWEAAQWKLAADEMKTKSAHIVPLPRQVIAILKDLQALTGRKTYIFANQQKTAGYMSENTVNGALKRMGYAGKMTAHGFRASFHTMADEQLGGRFEHIERQLAHTVNDKHNGAYNRTKYLQQRAVLVQEWADYLDNLKAQAIAGNVITGDFTQAK